jgi:hypothetical protein
MVVAVGYFTIRDLGLGQAPPGGYIVGKCQICPGSGYSQIATSGQTLQYCSVPPVYLRPSPYLSPECAAIIGATQQPTPTGFTPPPTVTTTPTTTYVQTPSTPAVIYQPTPTVTTPIQITIPTPVQTVPSPSYSTPSYSTLPTVYTSGSSGSGTSSSIPAADGTMIPVVIAGEEEKKSDFPWWVLIPVALMAT